MCSNHPHLGKFRIRWEPVNVIFFMLFYVDVFRDFIEYYFYYQYNKYQSWQSIVRISQFRCGVTIGKVYSGTRQGSVARTVKLFLPWSIEGITGGQGTCHPPLFRPLIIIKIIKRRKWREIREIISKFLIFWIIFAMKHEGKSLHQIP